MRHMRLIKNEHQMKFCFTYQYLGKKKKKTKNVGLPPSFLYVEYFQAEFFLVLFSVSKSWDSWGSSLKAFSRIRPIVLFLLKD